MVKEKINNYIDLFRKLYKASNEDSKTLILKYINAEEEVWDLTLNIIILFEDTQLAKEDILNFGLSGPTKRPTQGEIYLRTSSTLQPLYLLRNSIR